MHFIKNWLKNLGLNSLILLSLAVLLSACSTTTTGTQISGKNLRLPRYNDRTDLSKAVIVPEDVKDLFANTAFSISHPIKNDTRTGIYVQYPTEQLEHTSAFSKGFSTQIEVFKEPKGAQDTFSAAAAAYTQNKAKQINVANLADNTAAYKARITTSDGSDLEGAEYGLLIQAQHVLVQLVIRTDKDVSAQTLTNLGTLVLSRLSR